MARQADPPQIIHEAIEFDRNLIKLPFQDTDLDITPHYSILEYYRAAATSCPIAHEDRIPQYHGDGTTNRWSTWDDWCRKVIWWGNNKGPYLYGNVPVNPQAELAGHF